MAPSPEYDLPLRPRRLRRTENIRRMARETRLSTDHLIAWARDGQTTHRPAWADFNRRIRGARDAVGIWHETYRIPPGMQENIYTNMPDFGLGKVSKIVPVSGKGESGRERMAAAAR